MARISDLDLTLNLPTREAAQLRMAQRRLLALRLQSGGLLGDGRSLGPPLCVVFEGWDAAGEGGAIRRLTAALDPRHVRVAEFAAPTEREKRHHFLCGSGRRCPAGAVWRFLTAPGMGGCSSSGWRVATEPEWRRAYDEM